MSDDEGEPGQEEASEILFGLLTDLKLRSKLSATDVCVLSYWAVLAGAQGASLRKLAKEPGDGNTGRYSDHFDRATGMNLHDDNFAVIKAPMFSQAEGIRVVKDLIALPPQLTLQDEVEARANWDGDLSEFVSDMPPAYHERIVTKRAAPQVSIPCAVYFDGVQYATRSSLIGFWFVNMVTQRRHLMLSIRKGSLCRCGCHGWCTLWAIFKFLVWSIDALARGVHPTRRWDGSNFGRGEVNLASRANSLCPMASVVYLKADLMEFGTTLGFWTTSSTEYPCFLCDAKRHDLVELSRWDAATHPFNLRSWGEYESACASAEQWRYITRDQHTALRGLLWFDRRKDGRGLSLRADFAELDLKRGDRLEPWDGCQDIMDFEKISAFPAQVLFWRKSAERMTHHRNPIFAEFTGVLPATTIALDWMHTLSLGVFQTWGAYCVHALVRSDAWKIGVADFPPGLH